jgi:hypothetical protein
MTDAIPATLIGFGLLLLSWGYFVLDRGPLANRRALRLGLVGLPGLYLAWWIRTLVDDWAVDPSSHSLFAVEAAFLALVFFTWISFVTLVALLVARLAQRRQLGTPRWRDALFGHETTFRRKAATMR